MIPGGIGADPLVRPRRQLDLDLLEAEIGIGREDEVVDLQALVGKLLFRAEDMRVVLGKAAHAHQPVQRAGRFVAMNIAEFRKLYRQIAVGLQAVLEDLDVARTVHRLQRKDAIVVGIIAGDRHLEHRVAIPAPMAGGFPERLVEHLRRVDLLIAEVVEASAHIGNEVLEHLPALGMPEHDARPFLLEVEQVHLAAELAVIALFGLLKHGQIGLELGLVGPGRTVDARQHRVVGIAAPIGSGHLHQLEGVADLAGRGHVRAAAQIEPVALMVDLQVLVFRNGIDQLDLVGLALVAEHLPCPRAIPHLLGEGPVARDDLAHLLFDRREILRRERLVAGEVVVETVLDDRADRDLGAGPKLLHRFGQHMRGVVANEFQRALVLPGDDFDLAGFPQRIGQVAQGAVERIGNRLFGERFRDRFGELRAGQRRVVLADGTIGKCQGNGMGH